MFQGQGQEGQEDSKDSEDQEVSYSATSACGGVLVVRARRREVEALLREGGIVITPAGGASMSDARYCRGADVWNY